ncbi:MAG: M15 family metallopeptidase, partial [Gammaproteobacteria bacterium]
MKTESNAAGQGSHGPGVFVARPLIFILAALAGCANEIPQKGPPVVRSLTIYEELVRRDPSKRLVDLRDAIPGIVIDIRYATDQNFMKQPVYNIARPLLRAPAARALHAVQQELAKQGLGIKVWDAYRPYRVTKQMWDLIRDPDFVADPAKGSRHNREVRMKLRRECRRPPVTAPRREKGPSGRIASIRENRSATILWG